MKSKIKKGDNVAVIAGKDKGKTGSILKVFPSESRVLVSGINLVKRHTKDNAKSQAGIIVKEASLHVSNVALVDPKDSKPVRAGYSISQDGIKTRISRRSGEPL